MGNYYRYDDYVFRKIKEIGEKINKQEAIERVKNIGISVSSDRPYFEIQFHDVTFERVYLMIRNNSMISRVFVVNNDDNTCIKLPLDDFGLLYWIDCSTCDIAYDIRTFDENVVYYVRDIFLIVNDKDYKYVAERATFDDEEGK